LIEGGCFWSGSGGFRVDFGRGKRTTLAKQDFEGNLRSRVSHRAEIDFPCVFHDISVRGFSRTGFFFGGSSTPSQLLFYIIRGEVTQLAHLFTNLLFILRTESSTRT